MISSAGHRREVRQAHGTVSRRLFGAFAASAALILFVAGPASAGGSARVPVHHGHDGGGSGQSGGGGSPDGEAGGGFGDGHHHDGDHDPHGGTGGQGQQQQQGGGGSTTPPQGSQTPPTTTSTTVAPGTPIPQGRAGDDDPDHEPDGHGGQCRPDPGRRLGRRRSTPGRVHAGAGTRAAGPGLPAADARQGRRRRGRCRRRSRTCCCSRWPAPSCCSSPSRASSTGVTRGSCGRRCTISSSSATSNDHDAR